MADDDRIGAAVRILIAVLCAAAGLLIVLILSGSEIDETSGKAIGTAVAVAFFSLTGIAGSHLADRRPGLVTLGYVTTGISVVALLAVLVAIWSPSSSGDAWRVAGDAIVLAVASGHASLLLASAREDDRDAIRAARTGTILAIGLLSLMAIVEISNRGRDVGAKAFGVVAVLYVLGSILLPLLRRASPADASPDATTPTPATGAGILRLDHCVIAVSDWQRADAFYGGALGGRRIEGPDGRIAYEIGGQRLNVHGPETSAAPLPTLPVRPGNSDLCFVWNGSIATAIEHLRRHSVEIVTGPVSRIGAYGPGQSVYVHDPDGSLIELIAYG